MKNIDWNQMQDAQARASLRAEAELETAQQAARTYLTETDWYVTRKLETGQDIPADVAQARADARATLNKK